LRLARGIQNKVLEAMAMGRPVVAAEACVGAIDATAGEHLLAATAPLDFVAAVLTLLRDRSFAARLGEAGRARVQAVYGWDARLSVLDRYLAAPNA